MQPWEVAVGASLQRHAADSERRRSQSIRRFPPAKGPRPPMRAEARADRQVFQEQILRLTEQQGELGGQIEIIRDQLAAGG